MIKIYFFLFLLSLSILSCRPVETTDQVIFDYSKLNQITVSAQNKNINDLYELKYGDDYIAHFPDNPPVYFVNQWLTKNINLIGNENTFEINIIESSLRKKEIKNNEEKKYKEKTIFLYELKFLVEFILYDDSQFFLASTVVEVNRTITSSRYISLVENENIVNNLIYSSLVDLSNKAYELINIHLKDYVL